MASQTALIRRGARSLFYVLLFRSQVLGVTCPACHSTNTQRVAVSGKFPEPRLKPDGDPVVGTLVLTVIGGWIPALILYLRMGKLLSALSLFVATVLLFYALLRLNIKRNRHYNEKQYPVERDAWEHGFYCHECDHVFVPEP